MKLSFAIVPLVGSHLLFGATVTAKKYYHSKDFVWTTVVNSNDLVPEIVPPDRTFNSFNPPSVSAKGMVVFRGRSTGHGKGPVSGIFKREFDQGSQIAKVVARSAPNETSSTLVPDPNNMEAVFIEFPSFPRISINTNVIATRGMHKPVWKWTAANSVEEERSGTTGVYVELELDDGLRKLVTGASKLGSVNDDFANAYDVPYANKTHGGVFDVFPGAPSITDNNVVAFKGNFDEKTGVFFRQLPMIATQSSKSAKGHKALESDEVQIVASSDMLMPNCRVNFGSTAPPTAAGKRMVFVGLDDEENQSCGGIYQADLKSEPKLKVLISLGKTKVPGTKERLTKLGEGLSYDGEVIAFWAGWGDETKTVRLYCPKTGNKDRRAFCNQEGIDGGDLNSICDTDDQGNSACYQEKKVPLKQGVFLQDKRGKLTLIAHTGLSDSQFDDFIFWNYSGAPPGVGSEGSEDGDDKEPPRFRSSAFIAVSGGMVAFKARSGEVDENNIYQNVKDGIYLKTEHNPVTTIVETGMLGTEFDPYAVLRTDDEDSSSLVFPQSAPETSPTSFFRGTNQSQDGNNRRIVDHHGKRREAFSWNVFFNKYYGKETDPAATSAPPTTTKPPTPTTAVPTTLLVDEVAMERESLRGHFLAIAIGFSGTDTAEEEEDTEFSGIYLTQV